MGDKVALVLWWILLSMASIGLLLGVISGSWPNIIVALFAVALVLWVRPEKDPKRR